MSRDNQQIISVGGNGKVCLWNTSTGKLLESTTDGPNCAYLAWKARNGWNGEDDAGAESNNENPRIADVDQDIYLCNPMKNGNSFEKVVQFDAMVKDWDVDANEILWVYFRGKDLARLRAVAESSDTLEIVKAKTFELSARK